MSSDESLKRIQSDTGHKGEDKVVNDMLTLPSTSSSSFANNGQSNNQNEPGNSNGSCRVVNECKCNTNITTTSQRCNNLSYSEWDNIERETTCVKYKCCQKNNSCYAKVAASTSGLQASSNYQFDYNHLGSNLPSNDPDDADNSSSDTGNDDYSLGSEDGCIYTYRGGDKKCNLPPLLALPQDVDQHQRLEVEAQRPSSPEMDFLEMDFDPGPSCDADSDSNGVEQYACDDLEEAGHLEHLNDNIQHDVVEPNSTAFPQVNQLQETCNLNQEQPSTSSGVTENGGSWMDIVQPKCGNVLLHRNVKGQLILVRRTRLNSQPSLGTVLAQHTTSGDLICPSFNIHGDSTLTGDETKCTTHNRHVEDEVNLSSALYHCTMAKKVVVDKMSAGFLEDSDTSNLDQGNNESDVTEVERSMIWSEREAYDRQITQIGPSACGATAVINVFLALNIPVDIEKINSAVGTRQRAINAPLPRYLLSRAVAGCTASQLIDGLESGSDGRVRARFFPTYPERIMSLSHWLADWIMIGAVPILTLNLQNSPQTEAGEIPDAWHHQMVFGVSPRGVYLCNPMQCVPESVLWPQLCSDSVLLIRNEDVLSRFTPDTDLTVLASIGCDPRWSRMNVLGQVVHAVSRGGRDMIRIPCAYQAGVTVATLIHTVAHARLMALA